MKKLIHRIIALRSRKTCNETAKNSENTSPLGVFDKNLIPSASLSPKFSIFDIGDGILLVEERIRCQFLSRFLIDERNSGMIEFMNEQGVLLTITPDDIDWESLSVISEKARQVAGSLNVANSHGIHIDNFTNGVSEVCWMLVLDGRCDIGESGFTTGEIGYDIYGFIDRKGRVVSKFRYVHIPDKQGSCPVKDMVLLGNMREEAERAALHRVATSEKGDL